MSWKRQMQDNLLSVTKEINYLIDNFTELLNKVIEVSGDRSLTVGNKEPGQTEVDTDLRNTLIRTQSNIITKNQNLKQLLNRAGTTHTNINLEDKTNTKKQSVGNSAVDTTESGTKTPTCLTNQPTTHTKPNVIESANGNTEPGTNKNHDIKAYKKRILLD